MAKHTSYGKTLGIFYEAYRKFCRENTGTGKPNAETPEMFRQWFISNFVSCVDDATCCQLFIRDLRHELTHIYMKDSYLLEFLKTVEIKDIEGLKQYIKDNGKEVILNNDDNLEDLTTGINFGICLHIPKISQGYVFAYSLYDVSNELRIFVNHGMDQYHISSNEIENKKSVVYTDSEINEKSEPETVIPHFRRGYFKRLNSDFYKNKKGQIIFVHETVVNAQAKTLE